MKKTGDTPSATLNKEKMIQDIKIQNSKYKV